MFDTTRWLTRQIARAAWAGARVILRQVSPEADGIFNLIIVLHQLCDGDWERLAATAGVDFDHVQGFLDYAATFLSNVGNYFVRAPSVAIFLRLE